LFYIFLSLSCLLDLLNDSVCFIYLLPNTYAFKGFLKAKIPFTQASLRVNVLPAPRFRGG
jgi:hypothetical protein